MVLREPRLLEADPQPLARRLVELKMAALGTPTDVIDLVERQPALLLQDQSSGLDAEDDLTARSRAWAHGLLSDSDPAWLLRFELLQQYTAAHGDPHVGCREGDDRELIRWAAKQRSDYRAGSLDAHKTALLADVGFAWREEDAEWARWFLELRRTKERTDQALPTPGTDLTSFYLMNWCGVQRIARRCNRLSAARVELLDSLDFDWTGADALS